MYKLEQELESFYQNHVRLPNTEKTQLYKLKDLNIERLREGLAEYNEEKDTDYKIIENITQGSVAMSTIIQNESNDYDIDVAIVFEKNNLPEGTTATKNIVVNALKKKSAKFKQEPESKTNCVRIYYEEGYHVDFAIYRKSTDIFGDTIYEHCGSKWRKRDPRAINEWFSDENSPKENNLRITTRLLKMFCSSRENWIMPGGLVQTVLINEQFKDNERLDILFYDTLEALRNRLIINKEVYNPVDQTQSLKIIKKDDERLQRLQDRLTTYLEKLEVLFKDNCEKEDALDAWNGFFNHSYWQDEADRIKTKKHIEKASLKGQSDTKREEYIREFFPVIEKFKITLDCNVEQDGFRVNTLKEMLKNRKPLLPKKSLHFLLTSNNVPPPYDIYWKVKNRGPEAILRNMERGNIIKTNSATHMEVTTFKGEHFVECFIIKDEVCVAKDRIEVPIQKNI